MTEPTWRASADAATIYQDQVVPALMEEWAPRVVDAAEIRPGQHVLDVCCGTGVLARAAATRTGRNGAVTGLDLSPRMLAIAARLSPTLQWREGSADSLPFPDESFDAVVSQFGLMFVPDRVLALREMMRVLKPGGRVAVAVWTSLSDTPAYEAEVTLVERLAGSAAADPLRSPFVLGDRARMAELFLAAGIPDATIALHHGRGTFSSIRNMVELDLRVLLPMMDIALEEELIAEILRQAEQELRPHVSIDGDKVVFSSPAILGTAVKPARQ
ncbi:MAG TPA: methyltransferase domain-containing protein [Gemmatimonadaceae bacterium]|nr:methyltransferase domain-containing protein [Gemmatimonadaceae bacterium]